MVDKKYIESLPPVIGVGDVTKILGVNRDTVYKIVKQDDFPKLPIKKPILIPKEAFLRWAKLID